MYGKTEVAKSVFLMNQGMALGFLGWYWSSALLRDALMLKTTQEDQ